MEYMNPTPTQWKEEDPNMLTARDIAAMIDHSLLKPEMDRETVRQGCEIAKKYETASVCVKPCDLPIAAEILTGTDRKSVV